MDQVGTMAPFVAAGAVDSVVRKLAFVPGMTKADRDAITRMRLDLREMRQRHEPKLELSETLPEGLRRCLTGPARTPRYLVSRRAKAGRP